MLLNVLPVTEIAILPTELLITFPVIVLLFELTLIIIPRPSEITLPEIVLLVL